MKRMSIGNILIQNIIYGVGTVEVNYLLGETHNSWVLSRKEWDDIHTKGGMLKYLIEFYNESSTV